VRVEGDVLPVHETAPPSDVLVDELHGSENKVPFFLSICLFFSLSCLCILSLCVPFCDDFLFFFCLQIDDPSVPPEKVADKSLSGTGWSDGVAPTEPQSSIGAEVSDAEQGKTAEVSDAEQGKAAGGVILEKDPVEAAIETGGSAAAGPEKCPAAEPSVAVDAVQTQPTVFVVSDSPAAPASAGVLPDDAAMSTGVDDEETESDSHGGEVDHVEEVDYSSAATGLGKNP
jgi:hypothetical protein